MKFFDDDCVTEQRAFVDFDVNFAELENVFALKSFRIADVEAFH